MQSDLSHIALPDNAFDHLGVDPLDAEKVTKPSVSYWQDTWRRLKKNRFALIGLFVLILLILFSVFAPLLTPYHYTESYMDLANLPPSLEHPFGTDTLGRDLWARVWVGGRVSLSIGFIAALLQGAVGDLLGSASG